ncbi:hypothetical protein LA635_1532 [Erwinia amylovora LA635]|nr:hypothetical protein LA635_1532 [Erwinia amylovora LA635]CDK18523.1 hypothetical protein LA636_1531 [Erwinia amylovora LA636]CDK21892.1 hypothetical protein LA637_1532 [Erwinia amylovora LA637]
MYMRDKRSRSFSTGMHNRSRFKSAATMQKSGNTAHHDGSFNLEIIASLF